MQQTAFKNCLRNKSFPSADLGPPVYWGLLLPVHYYFCVFWLVNVETQGIDSAVIQQVLVMCCLLSFSWPSASFSDAKSKVPGHNAWLWGA